MEPSKSLDVSSASSETSSETSSGNTYIVPAEADSHQFYDVKLDEMVRGLMKFPANQMCLNCNTQGPQYVCTSVGSFVCKTCRDIHQGFGHTVKSVSDRFTFEEVNPLVYGRGNEHYVKDRQRPSLPDNSDVVELRKFIKRRYLDRGYTSDTDEEVYMEDAQEKIRKAKGKAHEEEVYMEEAQEKRKATGKAHEEEEGSGRKRKLEEVATEIPENVWIIKNLPDLSLPPDELVRKLRDLIRITVGVSHTSKALKPIIACTSSRHLKPYPKDLTIEKLACQGLDSVSGEVICLDCGNISGASLDWREAWVKSASFMLANFITFGKDTYLSWIPPTDDFDIRCGVCTGMEILPHIDSTVEINWLFLFLTSSYVPGAILEPYIQSRGIKLSKMPSQKELMFDFYMDMIQSLDPGGWAQFFFDKQTGVANFNH